jgi:hypothetical protein
MQTECKHTFDIRASREESARAGQDRKHSTRMLIEFSQGRDGLAHQVTAECIKAFWPVELLCVSAALFSPRKPNRHLFV